MSERYDCSVRECNHAHEFDDESENGFPFERILAPKVLVEPRAKHSDVDGQDTACIPQRVRAGDALGVETPFHTGTPSVVFVVYAAIGCNVT
jgi:hypothetical protein